MDMFDVIGPVMIGPSSSHTAGAARIGKITRMLLGGAPVEVHIGLWGSFLKTYRGHGTDRALIGGLLGYDCDDERLRGSLVDADRAGLRYTFDKAKLRHAHPNTVVIEATDADGRSISVQAASIGGGEIVVQSINGMEADISGHENTLVIMHRDTPGMIALISGTVAAHGLNIATMRVFRRAEGGDAMMALEIDGCAGDGLVDDLRALEDVFDVAYLAARHNDEEAR